MSKTRILFVSQEISPYLPDSPISKIARELPQAIQEKGREIRTFMPRFGCINERRNQLHEVIRLSGMNLIVDDNDQPLIIKVASIQAARMQVYFIDNEEFFQRKAVLKDKNDQYFSDNDERMLFFCKGVIETVKKLGWSPDVIHCQGWMTALLPVLIKKNYKDDPLFAESKIVYSLYNDPFEPALNHRLPEKLMLDGIDAASVEILKKPTYENLCKHAIQFADGVIVGGENVDKSLIKYATSLKKPLISSTDSTDFTAAYDAFYDEVLLGESIAEMVD
jgi:starch synthase